MTTDPHSVDHVPALPDPIVDNRGEIHLIVSQEVPEMGSAAVITSKKGTVRANHYHKEDWHYCYIITGGVDYYYREVDGTDEPHKIHVDAGQMIYTPALLEHAMLFTEDTTFLTLGGRTRQQEDYENDLVRVKLV